MASSTWASCKEESAAEVRNEDPPSPEGYAAYLKNSTRLVISEIVQLRDVFGPGAFNSPGCLGKRCEFGGHESETEPLILYLPGRIEIERSESIKSGVEYTHKVESFFYSTDERLMSFENGVESLLHSLDFNSAKSFALAFTNVEGAGLLEAWTLRFSFDAEGVPSLLLQHTMQNDRAVEGAAKAGALFSCTTAGALRKDLFDLIQSLRAYAKTLQPLPQSFNLDLLIQYNPGTPESAMPSTFRRVAPEVLANVFEAEHTPIAKMKDVTLNHVKREDVIRSPIDASGTYAAVEGTKEAGAEKGPVVTGEKVVDEPVTTAENYSSIEASSSSNLKRKPEGEHDDELRPQDLIVYAANDKSCGGSLLVGPAHHGTPEWKQSDRKREFKYPTLGSSLDVQWRDIWASKRSQKDCGLLTHAEYATSQRNDRKELQLLKYKGQLVQKVSDN